MNQNSSEGNQGVVGLADLNQKKKEKVLFLSVCKSLSLGLKCYVAIRGGKHTWIGISQGPIANQQWIEECMGLFSETRLQC